MAMMRIEEAAGLGDDVGEALVVRIRQIALERRGLDLADGQDGEHERVAAERIEVRADDDAALVVDARGELAAGEPSARHACGSRPADPACALRGVFRRAGARVEAAGLVFFLAAMARL